MLTNPKELPDDIKDLITFLKFVSSNLQEPKTENEFGLKNLCVNIYGFDKKVIDILVRNQIIIETKKGNKSQFQWGKIEPNPMMAQAVSNKLNEVIEKSVFESLDQEDDFDEEETDEPFENKETKEEKKDFSPYPQNAGNISILVTKNKRRRWEKFEIDYIESHLNEPAETLAIKLNRNLSSIETMIWKIKKTKRKESEVNHNKFWEREEINFVAENITKSVDFLCEHLKRKRTGVLTMIDRLCNGELEYILKNKGIVVPKKHYANHQKRWTNDEIKFMAANINEPFEFLVESIQRTPIAVNFIIEAIKEGKYNHIIGEELAKKISPESDYLIKESVEEKSETENPTVSKMEIVQSVENEDNNVDDLVMDEFKVDSVSKQTAESTNGSGQNNNLENIYKESELIFILLNKDKPVEWFKGKINRSRHSIRKKLGDMQRGMYKDMIRGKSEQQLNDIIKRYTDPTFAPVSESSITKQDSPITEESVIPKEISGNIKTPVAETTESVEPVKPVKQFRRQNQNWSEAEIETVMEAILDNPNKAIPIAELSAVIERSEKAIEVMIWRLTMNDWKYKLEAFKQKRGYIKEQITEVKKENEGQPIIVAEQGKEVKKETVPEEKPKRIKKMSILWGLFKWEKELKD